MLDPRVKPEDDEAAAYEDDGKLGIINLSHQNRRNRRIGSVELAKNNSRCLPEFFCA